MNMRIVLISLQKDIEVIGLKYLHYTLLGKGYDSSILFLPKFGRNRTRELESIREFISGMSPLCIGISLMSVEYHGARDLTIYLKKEFPSLPVIWGGIHPSSAPEECLRYADYVCIGEGEKALPDFAEAIRDHRPVRHVNNLAYLEHGRIRTNPLYPLIDALDELPFYEHIPANSFIQEDNVIRKIDRHMFRRYARYLGKSYSIMGSRGCPFACSYCCNSLLSKLYGTRTIRRRSAENVINELSRAVSDNRDIEYINFQDDCFLSASTAYLDEFSRLYREKIRKPFICRGIPAFVEREKMQILKDAGLAWISIGLQSGSDRILRDVYHRNAVKADFLRAATIARETRVAAYYDVILDNPFENDDDLLETIETLMKIPRPCFTQMFSLTFYKGTDLYQKVEREFPAALEPYRENYHAYRRTSLNDMVKIAVYLPLDRMQRIVDLYKQNGSGRYFRSLLFINRLLSALIYEPIAYYKTIKLSQGGSLYNTVRALPGYFGEGFRQYANQFRNV